MDKWEYTLLDVTNDSPVVRDSNLKRQLSQLGEVGWEAVSLVVPRYEIIGEKVYEAEYLVLLKRRKQG